MPAFTITVLPTLRDGSDSYAMDVNQVGEITGTATYPGGWWAVRWADGSAPEQLPAPADADLCWASSINDHGVITGACRTRSHPSGQGVVWSRDGAFHLVEAQGLDSFLMHGTNGGHYYGSYTVEPNSRRAAMWSRGQFIPLGYSGGRDEAVFGANEAGLAVGVSTLNDGAVTGILWRRGVPQTFAENGFGLAINRHGDVVGEMDIEIPFGAERIPIRVPTLWPANRQAVVLRAHSRGEALDISDRGEVVGWFRDVFPPNNYTYGAFWFDGTTSHNLAALVVGENPFDELFQASAINNRGEIVGYGRIGSDRRGFLLKPVRRRPQ